MKRSLHPVGRTGREAASESTVIEERQFNAGGTLTALTRFTWGADLSGTMQGAGGVGGLLTAEEIDLADIDPPVAHYYWYDGNGNVTGITDDSGAIEGTYRYTSFGALAETATTTAFAEDQPWKFSTKYHDTEVEPVAGTYCYGYRFYLPSIGRWPSRDPIGERGGMNLYWMCRNNPTNWVDLLGLDAASDFLDNVDPNRDKSDDPAKRAMMDQNACIGGVAAGCGRLQPDVSINSKCYATQAEAEAAARV